MPRGIVVGGAGHKRSLTARASTVGRSRATKEPSGVTNCRAFRRVGGRDDILAMRTNGHSYLSVRAEGRKGKFRNSIVGSPAGAGERHAMGPHGRGRREAHVGRDAAGGDRDPSPRKGGYTMLLGGSEDRDDVNLGKSAPAAWKRVKECVVASGG